MLVTADLAAFFKLWWAQISYQEALSDTDFSVDGIPNMTRDFPIWFGWNVAQPDIRNLRRSNAAALRMQD